MLISEYELGATVTEEHFEGISPKRARVASPAEPAQSV